MREQENHAISTWYLLFLLFLVFPEKPGGRSRHARKRRILVSLSLFFFLVRTVRTISTKLISLIFLVAYMVPTVPRYGAPSVDGWPRPLMAVDADLKYFHYGGLELSERGELVDVFEVRARAALLSVFYFPDAGTFQQLP